MDRIKCSNCDCDTGVTAKTKLVCQRCYDKLQAELADLQVESACNLHGWEETSKENNKLQAELAACREALRWIPVGERLPELKKVGDKGATLSDWVRVSDGERIVEAYYYDNTNIKEPESNQVTGKGWYCHGMRKSNITHWRYELLPGQDIPANPEVERLRKVAKDVADDLRYLTQKGRSGIPEWISNRASYCILAIEQALASGQEPGGEEKEK